MSNLPSGWITIPLGLIGIWRGGGTPPKSNPDYWAGGWIPWVSPKDMKIDFIDATQDYITEAAVASSSTQIAPKGSVLLVTRSGILKHTLPVAVAMRDMAFNQDIKAISSFSDLEPEYLFYHLKADSTHILASSAKAGTTVDSLDTSRLKAYNLRIAPPAEQKRIVSRIQFFISRTTHARNHLDKIPRLLEEYKSSVLDSAFSGRLTEDFRRESGTQFVNPAEFPESWGTKLLGDIADIQGGIQVGKKRPPGTELVEVPYLRVANVQRGWLNLDEIKTIAVTQDEKDRLRLQPGDILMNEGGDRDKLGRGWIWNGEFNECIHQNHVFRIRLKDHAFPAEYISHYANEKGQRYFIDQGTQTTNLASISMRKIAALPIPIPPADEAVEIVRRVEATFAWIESIANDTKT